jgi:hypothetical protein
MWWSDTRRWKCAPRGTAERTAERSHLHAASCSSILDGRTRPNSRPRSPVGWVPVRKHLENIYAKLGVPTRTAAVTRFLGVLDDEACDYFAQIVLNCSNGCLHALQ